MAALGIPTTRSLAVVTTGEPVYRATALPGAILTRVAASHIRVGTFEYLAVHRDVSNLRLLADYAIHRHYPAIADTPGKYLEFFRAVADRQASLIAQWQLIGFIHERPFQERLHFDTERTAGKPRNGLLVRLHWEMRGHNTVWRKRPSPELWTTLNERIWG